MKKIKFFVLTLFLFSLFLSCKQKKNDVMPAITFIKNDIADVDSSVYSIIKLTQLTDSTYDTAYVKREDFKTVAKDFLETPDISKKFGGKYTEARIMDNNLNQALFLATTTDENLEVRRQEVRVVPNPPNDIVKSVYLERYLSNKDSSVTKRMTWYINKKFQVITIIEKNGQPEKTSVEYVIWNDKDNQ